MNVGFHQIAHRLEYQPMTGDGGQAAKRVGHDAHVKMALAAGRAGMAGGAVSLVVDVELTWREVRDQGVSQPLFAGLPVAHVSSGGAGLILPLSQSTWGTMNTIMARVMPNTLKLTQALSDRLRAT